MAALAQHHGSNNGVWHGSGGSMAKVMAMASIISA